MRTIYEYTLEVGENSIKMPRGAMLLRVGGQGESVCLWALVDTENRAELRHLRAFRTGQELPDDFVHQDYAKGVNGERYIGTALCGEFVWHVFERWARAMSEVNCCCEEHAQGRGVGEGNPAGGEEC